YQKEKQKGSREEINNATAQKLQKTLNWTSNNWRKGTGSAERWRPQDSPPDSRAVRELSLSVLYSEQFLEHTSW
ncbi:hypothetical protein HPG69_013646, partial [Diceros bicornis minor]